MEPKRIFPFADDREYLSRYLITYEGEVFNPHGRKMRTYQDQVGTLRVTLTVDGHRLNRSVAQLVLYHFKLIEETQIRIMEVGYRNGFQHDCRFRNVFIERYTYWPTFRPTRYYDAWMQND